MNITIYCWSIRLPLRHSFQNTIAKIVTTKMRISSLATASGDMTPTVLSSPPGHNPLSLARWPFVYVF